MNAASWPRANVTKERLLVVDPESGRHEDLTVAALPSLLAPGDVLVVNDAGTLPASLRARTSDGTPLELRIATLHNDERASCVLFGDGDWREDTDARAPPPLLARNDTVTFDGGTIARVTLVSSSSARLVELVLGDGASWSALAYAHGAPVQYAYMRAPLPVSLVQTPYASTPWAVEMPSAGRALSFSVLRELAARGVHVARLRHAAGLSATGDAKLDALLPLPERYRIPPETVALVEQARREGGRVIAVGTSVVRALEGCVREHGRLTAGEGITNLILDEHYRLQVADGVLSGMHDRGTSHAKLLSAVAPRALLDDVLRHAEEERYLVHEFGDHLLVLPGALPLERRALRGRRASDKDDARYSAAIEAAGASASAAALASTSANQERKPFFLTRT